MSGVLRCLGRLFRILREAHGLGRRTHGLGRRIPPGLAPLFFHLTKETRHLTASSIGSFRCLGRRDSHPEEMPGLGRRRAPVEATADAPMFGETRDVWGDGGVRCLGRPGAMFGETLCLAKFC